ncbi:MAG: DUF819 family protein [Spirochaetales bacterium]|nr:DUF819 family protein [Spirochaetales bacterium]
MPGLILAIFSFAFPLLLIVLKERSQAAWFAKVNPVIACYIAGILLANMGLVPAEAAEALDLVQTASVALSIPLLLFTVNLSRSKSLTGRAGLSMVLAGGSVMVMVALAHVIFQGQIEESARVAGMVVGVYTGGTPNLAAISKALGVSQSAYLTVHTADLVFSSLYLLFVMTLAKPFLAKILPAYTRPEHHGELQVEELEDDSYGLLLQRSSIPGMVLSLVFALVVAALGGAVFLLAPPESAMVLTILALTTLSLGASFLPFVRKQKMSYPLGQYLILVFCVSVGALADLKILVQAAPTLFLFVGLCLFGSFALHILLAKAVGIDGDTVLITSTSAICSPPFVGLTASTIGNKDLIAPGITTGLLGHAAGNYLGVLVARLLTMMA